MKGSVTWTAADKNPVRFRADETELDKYINLSTVSDWFFVQVLKYNIEAEEDTAL